VCIIYYTIHIYARKMRVAGRLEPDALHPIIRSSALDRGDG
jgi:hypothetical protein